MVVGDTQAGVRTLPAMSLVLPFQVGRRLVDLVQELERRLTGAAAGPGLESALASAIPAAESYVLVLFDGLGSHQLDHPAGRSLASASTGTLSAPFPTTTTVSMATIATGLEPGTHGVIGHLMWIPELGSVVNVLKWVTPHGAHIQYDTAGFLPAPNLWERLRAAGIEPITVQPGDFAASPLTRLLYRGCRFEPVYTVDEAIEATTVLAREPGRLVFTYFPQLDYAAHVWGQRSGEYAAAMNIIDNAWSMLTARATVPIVGTADHGHLDYGQNDKLLIREEALDSLVFFGDPRALFVRGEHHLIEQLADTIDVPPHWIGDGHTTWTSEHHPHLAERLPSAVFLAPDNRVLLPKGFDKRLTGYHGGLHPAEVDIPLLVG